MEDANKILVASRAVKDFLLKAASLGGKAKSARKTAACKINGGAPCHPGKKRGRPPGSKNKKK